MLKMKADNRTRLLQAAEKTAYLYGFASASIADIAKEAKVPVGNVYYYFKTKDEIAAAIVDLRVSRFKKQLQDLEKESPKDRLCGFVDIKIRNSETLAHHGCPVGTLCSELQKYGGASAKKSRALFAEALAWMERQFAALGKGADSRASAVHLLSATQGVSVLAHTFRDPTMIKSEAARLKQWIQAL